MTDANSIAPAKLSSLIRYFVDEAGDPVLFGANGQILVGSEGCSKYFILGKLEVGDEMKLSSELSELRAQLLADPYFKGVPSMQLEAKKTAVAFHAKDDLAEVRREVFKLLLRQDVKFYAVVREKSDLTAYVKQQNDRDATYRYRPNELYDLLVTELFSKFHGVAKEFHICFAERGQKDRTKALEAAIKKANQVFEASFNLMNPGRAHVSRGTPESCASLQAADYFLWAIQRFYERGEDRYAQLIWPQTIEVYDIDLVESGRRGISFNQSKPLIERIKKSGI